jgi:hypothetical protein
VLWAVGDSSSAPSPSLGAGFDGDRDPTNRDDSDEDDAGPENYETIDGEMV